MNFPCCKVAAYSSWVPISFTPIAPQRKEGLWSLGSGPQTRAGTLIPALHGVGSVSSELRKLLPAVVPRAVRHCGVCGGGGETGEVWGEQRAPLTLHVLSASSAEQGPHKPVPSQGADKEAG